MSNLNANTQKKTSNVDHVIPVLIGFGINIVLALVIIHLFLTPQIYMQSPLYFNVLFYGLLGAVIPLLIIFICIKTGKMNFPVNGNTEGLIKLVHQPWGPAVISISAGISEELLFRGAIFELLNSHFSQFSSVLIISLLFMLSHLPQYKKSPLLNVVMFIISLMFTFIYILSGLIWAPILAHTIYNYVVCYWMKNGFLPLGPSNSQLEGV